MRDLDLFQRALGLDEPWQVVGVEFDAAQRRLDLRVDFPKGSRFVWSGGLSGEGHRGEDVAASGLL
jgi:hypothetical protein